MLNSILSWFKSILSIFNITFICHIVNKCINIFLDIRKEKKLEKQQKAIDEANKKIEDACNSGTLNDLFEASKEAGKANCDD